MFKKLKALRVGVSTAFFMAVFKAQTTFAEYDDVNSGGYDAVNGSGGGRSSFNGGTSTPSEVFKGYNPVTSEQMEQGRYWASPLTNVLGIGIGVIMSATFAWVFFQTALDLLYWAVPPLRGLLARQNPAMQGGGMMGMQPQQQQSSGRSIVCVSDEMLQAMEEAGNQASQGGMGGGMPMGGGGMGMPPMGGMGMQQAPPSRKNVLVTYFKKRILSVVILGVCATVLFSSMLLDTGINMGQFVLKIISYINDVIVSNT
ncbi:hypothetical protein P9X10_00490 [Bacillus cereus]|nr:hypothetical protein [Bacillus cereus]